MGFTGIEKHGETDAYNRDKDKDRNEQSDHHLDPNIR